MELKTLIKWVGTKRTQSAKILEYIPKEIDTYYEPFVGGGSIFIHLMADPSFHIKRYVLSDISKDLIGFWNLMKDDHISIMREYRKRYENIDFTSDDTRKAGYYAIRERYNEYKDTDEHIHDFFFLMRSSFNGMARWNKNTNKFNAPCGPSMIKPDTLDPIIEEWHNIISQHDVEFICQSYENIRPQKGDYVYMDPPYARMCIGTYADGVSPDDFISFLRTLKDVPYSFSYDGKSGTKDYTYPLPEDIYDGHIYIPSARSGFRNMTKIEENLEVADSFYYKET